MRPGLKYLFGSCLMLLSLSACYQADNLDTEGHSINYKGLRGRWLVFSYMADWCDVCHQEVAMLNQLQRKHPEIKIFGVSVEAGDTQQRQAEKKLLGIEFQMLQRDPAHHFGYKAPEVVPFLVFISPEGHLVKTYQGLITMSKIETILERASL